MVESAAERKKRRQQRRQSRNTGGQQSNSKAAAKTSSAQKKTTAKKQTAKTTKNTKTEQENQQQEQQEDSLYNALLDVYSQDVDQFEKKTQILTGINENQRLSSGMLCFDLFTNGGLVPAMYQISGPEQSAKSTLSWHVIGSALENKIPLIMMFNAEGTMDPDYSANILQVEQISDIIGQRDNKGKNWIKKPKIRYYTDNVIEKIFKLMQQSLNNLPDKRYREDKGQWYLVFGRKKSQTDRMKMMQQKGLSKHDRSLYTETGMYWCPVGEDDSFQGLFIVDSWPALLLEKTDEEEEDNSMALEARAFSKELRKVKGKLNRKRCIIWGVNQVRQRPATKWGSPEYEPGGEALKFYSDVRNQVRARAKCQGWDPKEPSVIDSKKNDNYDYKLLKNVKNKLGSPIDEEVWMRVWKSDHKRKGRGFDPAFDTFYYLNITGQINGYKKKFTIDHKSVKDIQFNWLKFKKLILAEHFDDNKMKKEVREELGIKKMPNLRKICFDQIKDGTSDKLLLEKQGKKADEPEGHDEDLEDIEDD